MSNSAKKQKEIRSQTRKREQKLGLFPPSFQHHHENRIFIGNTKKRKLGFFKQQGLEIWAASGITKKGKKKQQRGKKKRERDRLGFLIDGFGLFFLFLGLGFGTVGKWRASDLWLVAERIWGASVLSPLDHRSNISSGTHVED